MKLSLRAALLPNNLEQTHQKIMFWLVQAFHWPIVEAFSREGMTSQVVVAEGLTSSALKGARKFPLPHCLRTPLIRVTDMY